MVVDYHGEGGHGGEDPGGGTGSKGNDTGVHTSHHS